MNLNCALIFLGASATINSLTNPIEITETMFKNSIAMRLFEEKMPAKDLRRKPVYGVYTKTKKAARILANATGSYEDGKIDKPNKKGHYSHFHDKNHVFHIWYGKIK